MKALTVLQPYAALIANPPHVKLVENRPWRTHHRGELAIHAGKSQRLCGWTGTLPEPLHFQAIVAVVQVLDCVPVDELDRGVPYAVGPCWILGNVRPLAAPVPCGGKQGLWNVPRPIEGRIWAQAVRALRDAG